MAVVPIPSSGGLISNAVIAGIITMIMGFWLPVDGPPAPPKLTDAQLAPYFARDHVFKWTLKIVGGVILAGAVVRSFTRGGAAVIAVGEALAGLTFAVVAVESFFEWGVDMYFLITLLLAFLAGQGARDAWRIRAAESAVGGHGAEPDVNT